MRFVRSLGQARGADEEKSQSDDARDKARITRNSINKMDYVPTAANLSNLVRE
jgi:hypothetical protein